jgi:hypothetical protein
LGRRRVTCDGDDPIYLGTSDIGYLLAKGVKTLTYGLADFASKSARGCGK